ncbi:50S ribosomal protein L23 [Patescibacteria group bacterium]|nr:50S ribosomal protein L23 [Patescibacteria group bacterium]
MRTAPVILKSPHIAEKASYLAKMNQYVFKVYPQTNKTEVKKAVEEVYGVDVLKIKMITIPKKRRRIGKTFGWRKGYKKAIVSVKKGQSIEILPR